jgi:D-amino-acid dehydrogenase
MPDAIVLGAGMAGVSTALHLRQRGWQVTVVDRREPGRETSYGNAGLIQAEAVEPYPMPRNLAALVAIAARRGNDVHYHPASLPQHLWPLLQYWWHSAPGRHRRIAAAYATLIREACAEHDPFITAAGAGNLVRREGYRMLFRDPAALAAAVADAARLNRDHGVASEALDAAGVMRVEPALRTGAAGAIHWQGPWSVSDPGGLVEAYAGLLARLGGTLLTGDAGTLARAGRGWRVQTADGAVEAEHAVIALGPWSGEAMRRLGLRVTMVRKRGYHRHYAPVEPLQLPLMDAARGYLLVPTTRGTRITTGAELARTDAPATPVQLGRAEAAARELVDLGQPVEAEPWVGTRPCMPDMLPVLGRADGQPGLWLNFGHGHQGFTLGPATGRLVAEQMNGETPFVNLAPFAFSRFS